MKKLKVAEIAGGTLICATRPPGSLRNNESRKWM
jgi:hypothetical protein